MIWKKKAKPVCCGEMENFGPGHSEVKWYQVDSQPNQYVMPYIQTDQGRKRINNCPSCGADVRNVYVEDGIMKIS